MMPHKKLIIKLVASVKQKFDGSGDPEVEDCMGVVEYFEDIGSADISLVVRTPQSTAGRV